MTVAGISRIVTNEFVKAQAAAYQLLSGTSIMPCNLRADYAIINITTNNIIAIGITWSASDGSGYSLKWDIPNEVFTDLYRVYPLEHEFYSSQIDMVTLDPIINYKHIDGIEYKLNLDGDVLQENYIAAYSIPEEIRTALTNIEFPCLDDVIYTANKPYGTVAEFNINRLVSWL